MSLKYRPEIDGLRTIAVGAVLIYHAKFSIAGLPLLTGGFVGVDIFFVISGFLITSLLLQEWQQTGGFSITHFYERRARRLLPALFLVIFASLPFAWLLLLPSQMMDFVKSLLSSVFFVSNMYWNGSLQTYGAESGLLKPFLHTWSLAVEEQFYIFFPLILLAALRRMRPRNLLIGIILTIGLGLIVAELSTFYDRNLSFYWLVSRIWELLSGSLLAYLLFHHPDWGKDNRLAPILPGLGLFLILGAMGIMKLDWHHPGVGTIPAVFGTVLIIWFATPAEPVTRLLSSRLFVGIGLISYSLYLWHYPIFAFGRILNPDAALLDKTIWFALSIAMAVFSYRFVETPFRSAARISRSAVITMTLAASLVVITFSGIILMQDGRKARFPELIALYGENEFDNPVLQDASWQVLADLADAQALKPSEPHDPSVYETKHLWFSPDSPARKVLLIGNSHSKDMFNAFHLNIEAFPDYQFARFALRASLRNDQVDALFASPNYEAADVIALAFRYTPRTLRRLPALIERILATGKTIIVFENTVEFQEIDHMPVFDWYFRNKGRPENIESLNALAYEKRDLSETDNLNRDLEGIAQKYGLRVLKKSDFICDDTRRTCHAITPEMRKVFFDYGHFTLDGARFFGKRIAEMEWFSLD